MQPNIYITADAMKTVNTIQHLDYYERVCLSDNPETDLTTAPGYWLNTNALRLAELHANADVALHLTPDDSSTYKQHVTIAANLRGVIFSGAPHLPPGFAESIGFWSPLTPTPHHRGAVFYQNILNAYCVNLNGIDESNETFVDTDSDQPADVLLSDGLVVCVTGLAALINNFNREQFVALTIPINPTMLGIELEGYRTEGEYVADAAEQSETIYLRIADIMASPMPDFIALCAIRTELSDYGYTY
jgi:hypothetical protein